MELIILAAQALEAASIRAQGIKESANFRFQQRLSVIFGFLQDCLSYLASTETVGNLLFPAESVVLGK